MRARRMTNQGGQKYSFCMKLLCFYAVGAIIGIIVAKYLPQSFINSAGDKLQKFAALGFGAIFIRLLFMTIKMPAIILIASLTRFGGAIIPILFLYQGAASSSTVSLCLRAYGSGGFFASFISYFLMYFFTLICMLIIGSTAMENSLKARPIRRGSRLGVNPSPDVVFAFMGCFVLCIVFSVISCFIAPFIFRAAVSLISL